MRLDIISIGSATEDVFVHVPEKFSKDSCIFRAGAKIDINSMEYFIGGGATNTSVAFSRLGLKAGILCAVGEDGAGESVLKELKKEKVNTSSVMRIKGKNTSYSVILTGFGRDRVILCYSGITAMLAEKEINWGKINSEWLYISSLHTTPQFLRKIAQHSGKKEMKIAFNPGQQELTLGLSGLKDIFGKCAVLLLNRQEALKLTGNADISRNLKIISEVAEIVVITDGKDGAYASDGKHYFQCPSFGTKPLDVTGAGDSFGSGFVAAIIKGKGIEDALLWGTANANSVIQHLGTKNILLNEKQIKKDATKGKVVRKKL